MNTYVKNQGNVFGFPNPIGAKVYARDNWGVILDIGEKLTLPFTLMADRRIRLSQTMKGRLARSVSTVVSPIMGAWRRRQFQAFSISNVHTLNNPSTEFLFDVFMRYNGNSQLMMTYRDIEHIQWRLIDAPYQKTFYCVGDINNPSLIMVTRIATIQGLKTLRILDYFGDIDNDIAIRSGVQMAMKEAANNHVDQIRIISTRPNVIRICRELGFSISEDISFCWYTADEEEDQLIRQSDWHWTFSDYDFDIEN